MALYCKHCRDSTVPLSACNDCFVTLYCGVKCQSANWGDHMNTCVKIRQNVPYKLFRREYINHAWGYTHIVTTFLSDGSIYESSRTTLPALLRQLDEMDLQTLFKMYALYQNIVKTPKKNISMENDNPGSHDAGIVKWFGFSSQDNDMPVLIQESGDVNHPVYDNVAEIINTLGSFILQFD